MIGEFAGPYRIDRQLGAGGMGTVYAAEHELLGRKAAVKVLLPEMTAKPDMVRRFLNEARAVAAIRNDHIVKIYDLGTTQAGQVYIAMELLEGETLGARRSRAAVPFADALSFVRQMALALGAAHQANVVHRDLKPDNVFLAHTDDAEAPTIKLLDFGVAKLMWPDELAPTTRTGTIIGTPTYMAPEQCRGVAVDHRADLYALGCILFELIGGRPPFRGEGMGDVLTAHIHVPAPTLRSLVPAVPAPVNALVERLLAKKPDDRPQSAQRVIEHLDAIAAGLARMQRPRRPTDQVATLPHLPAIVAPEASLSRVPEAIDDAPMAPPPPAPTTTTLPVTPGAVEHIGAEAAGQRDYPSTLSRASQVRTPPVVPRRRWPWAAGGAAVAISLAVVAVLSLRGRRRDDAPVPIVTTPIDAGAPIDAVAPVVDATGPDPIEMVDERIALVVVTRPEGARVSVDRDRVGRSNLNTTIGRRKGAVVITLALAGYDPRTISRLADRDIRIDVPLVPTSVSIPLPDEESGGVQLMREARRLKLSAPDTAYEKAKLAHELDPDVEFLDDLAEYALRVNDREGAKGYLRQYLLNGPTGTAATAARKKLVFLEHASPAEPAPDPLGGSPRGPRLVPPIP